MNKFDITKFITKLVNLGERQLQNETLAAELIKNELDAQGISFKEEKYFTFIPRFKKTVLRADGKDIKAKSTSFVSGRINSKSNIISSLISSQKFLYESNINFNPQCESISRSNHYFAPSVAVSKNDLPKILKAKKVSGLLVVEKTKHQSSNILVGETHSPKNIIFCHYDSISTGASDNASGCAIVLSLILREREKGFENLYVIAGNEELSYDEGIYWGHGYRVFESKHKDLLHKAKSLIVIDSVGQSKTQITQDPKIVRLGFPLSEMERYSEKTYMISGQLGALMDVYHSDLDTVSCLKKSYVDQAEMIALKLAQ